MGSPRVIRPEAPAVLREKSGQWTRELLATHRRWLQRGRRGKRPAARRDRYSHPRVREAVRAMYHNLCCYCESPLEATSYMRVEHYRPKGVDQYLQLAYAWENLHAACEKCNGSKLEKFDENCRPVIPTEDDPLDHIHYTGGLPIAITPRGRWTLVNCGIDGRTQLFMLQADYLRPYRGYLKLVEAEIQRRKSGLPLSPRVTVRVEEAFDRMQRACAPSARWSTTVRSLVEPKVERLRAEWEELQQAGAV